jgi:hypothetical protein
MKNFSDLLATDPQLDLELAAEPVGIPDVEIWVNQNLIYQGQVLEPITVSTKLPLLAGFSVMVKLKNKVYTSESETAIVLTRFSVDGFDLVPQFTHLARYNNDHDFKDPTSYIGFNGEWKFEIDRPFYQWRHVNTGQGWLFQPCRLTEIL